MQKQPILSEDRLNDHKQFRSANKVWRSIAADIYTPEYMGAAISYDMLIGLAEKHGLVISRASLIVKMARYKKSGIMKPARKRGTFFITEKGKLFFGLTERPKQKKTAVLPTPPSKWGQKARKINQAAATAR